MGFEESMRAARERLEAAEGERESVIKVSRKLTRTSKTAIHAVHSRSDPDGPMAEMERLADDLRRIGGGHGAATDALSEYAEARVFHAVVSGNEIPSWESMDLEPGPWVMGVADAIGELRRFVVRLLMEGKLDGAEKLFRGMEAMADELMLFDVPDAVVPLRRKQDIARGVVERTRSDLAVAKIMER